MIGVLREYVVLSIRAPEEAVRRVLRLELARSTLWLALACAGCLTAILITLSGFVLPQPDDAPQFLPRSPLLLAIMFTVVNGLTAIMIDVVGRGFGGRGTLDGALAIVVLLQFVMLVLQLGLVAVTFVSAGLGGLVWLGLMGLNIWLMVSFIAELHGFVSRWSVFVGLIGTLFGLGVGLILLASLLAFIFGVEAAHV